MPEPNPDEVPAPDLRALLADPEVVRILRQRAHAMLTRQGHGRQHETLSLVNRAVLRALNDRDGPRFEHRDALLSYLVLALRSALLEEVRRGQTDRRGGGWRRASIEGDASFLSSESGEEGIREFFDVLAKLRARRALSARVTELRVLLDATWDEVASELAVTVGKAREEWEFARAWLRRDMRAG